MRIETERLLLREMNQDDYDALSDVLADSDIMQHDPYTFDEQRVRGWLALKQSEPMFENVDCIQMHVDDLDKGLAFYRDALGLKLLWRTGLSCGLGMKKGLAEIVLTLDHHDMVDLKVHDVESELPRFLDAGGKLITGAFDIDIGKCAVVADPWENQYCILDMTKGTYDTDQKGVVNGVSKTDFVL